MPERVEGLEVQDLGCPRSRRYHLVHREDPRRLAPPGVGHHGVLVPRRHQIDGLRVLREEVDDRDASEENRARRNARLEHRPALGTLEGCDEENDLRPSAEPRRPHLGESVEIQEEELVREREVLLEQSVRDHRAPRQR